jgi:regulator of protease activity HflC (stomatin/prohibitin superfamily)
VAEGNGDDESKPTGESQPQPRTSRAPIGGMVRDPKDRDVKVGPSLTAYLRDRLIMSIDAVLVGTGLKRPRNADGTLGPRSWKRLFITFGTLVLIVFIWTSIHIVPPGNVAVPVTLGHSEDPIGPGFHITLPFTTTYNISVRVQNYTMSSSVGDGALANVDDSIPVLGSDGGSANVNATVLYRVDPKQATFVYKTLGRSYATAIVRPTARRCIRNQFTLYPMVQAATSDWGKIQTDATECLKQGIEPLGLIVQDFQLREVKLDPGLFTAVSNKVSAQQRAQQQQFELAVAQQAADITRVQALGTADAQQILKCGGKPAPIVRNGTAGETVVPNTGSACTPSDFSAAYLQYIYVQALNQLATSPNAKTIVLPFDKNLTPLLTLDGGSGTVATPPTSTGK